MKLLTTLVLIFYISGVITKSVKKSTEDAAAVSRTDKPKDVQIEPPKKFKSLKLKSRLSKKAPPPAIIAIEIVDPNDNSTKSKTSKRTIQSALGYGIPSPNSYGVTDKPKLMFYKYSQEDIPPYQGHSSNQGYIPPNNNVGNYDNQNIQQQNGNFQVQKAIRYDLGTTQHVEYPKHNYEPTTLFATLNPHGQVGGFTQNVPLQGHNAPVILLKVYTNQLGGAIYPNLPANHPYAGLNGVNLQSMLNNFFDKHFYQQPNNQQYQDVGYQQNYQTNQQVNYQNYQPQVHSQTQSQVHSQTQSQPQTQLLYAQPQNQGQDYYLNQPNQYHQQYQDDVHQYQYNQQFDYDNLPTHENYPSDAHTRVVFHPSKTGAKDLQQPQALPSKNVKYPPAQSYSSLEFHNHQPSKSQDYDDYDYQYPQQQDYSLKQNQDDQGYYYYKPDIQQILQNLQAQKNDYQTLQQNYQGSQQDYKGLQQNYKGLQQNYDSQQDYQESQDNYEANKQDYGNSQQEYQSPTEISGSLNEKGQVDTQKVSTPHNYHAHPNGKSNQKRTVGKPESIRRINTPKIKE